MQHLFHSMQPSLNGKSHRVNPKLTWATRARVGLSSLWPMSNASLCQAKTMPT